MALLGHNAIGEVRSEWEWVPRGDEIPVGTCPDPLAIPTGCAAINNTLYLDLTLKLAKDADQLQDPSAETLRRHKVSEHAKSVSADCAVTDPIVLKQEPEKAMLAGLKCQFFRNQLEKYDQCYAANGIDIRAPRPADWDGSSWSGADEWNRRLAALPASRRCEVIKQALHTSISRIASAKPSFIVHHSPIKTCDDCLMVRNPPKPGHLQDRLEAGWALRELNFTDPALVPASCKAAYQEGQFRWTEAFNLWHQRYPQCFSDNPSRFGRQPLGYAFFMCGRCNNAHWIDSVSKLMRCNEQEPDPSKRVEIDPEIAEWENGLNHVNYWESRGGKAVLGPASLVKYRGPQDGEIDWLEFLGGAKR